jgi:hypothetical protein
VAHSGPIARGSFVQTLVLTDIATGWTECAPLLVREQSLLVEVLTEIREHLPFALLGFDTDNDGVFMNGTVQEYCRNDGIEFTRCRPYRKNDQAWVEQKTGSIVRRMVGYQRFEGLEAAAALAHLYARVRLFVNFFQPSFKLAEDARRRAGEEAAPPAGDAVPAIAGRPADPGGGARSGDSPESRPRSGSPAGRNTSSSTTAGGDCRQADDGRCACTNARGVSYRAADCLEGGWGASDRPSCGEGGAMVALAS